MKNDKSLVSLVLLSMISLSCRAAASAMDPEIEVAHILLEMAALPASSSACPEHSVFKPAFPVRHKGIWICPLCNKDFRWKSALRRHIKNIHERERHYCSLCPASFTQIGGLNRHIKSIHEQLNYACPLCKKPFAQKSYLKHHMKSVHERVRYQCPFCALTFTFTSAVQAHIRKRHNAVVDPVPLCDRGILPSISAEGCSANFREKRLRPISSFSTEIVYPEIDSSHKKQRGNV